MSSTSTAASIRQTAEIAGLCKLSKDARGLLRESMTPDDYLEVLNRAGLHLDGLNFLAFMFERRRAVWWGCQCLWLGCRERTDPKVDSCVETIVRWVLEPDESARRRCEKIMNEMTFRQPLGLLAQAAFASGGSLAPDDLPPVPPPTTLTASCVSAALQVEAAARPDPDRARQQFVLLGLDIAHGKNLWS